MSNYGDYCGHFLLNDVSFFPKKPDFQHYVIALDMQFTIAKSANMGEKTLILSFMLYRKISEYKC